MKPSLTAATLMSAMLLGGVPAMAQPGPDAAANRGTNCLWTYMIDHTHVVNPRTVVFYMKDGKAWTNTLKGPCPGLEFHGFGYVTHSDQICSNAVPIRVIETGEVCALGAFAPGAPPRSAP
jgi:hypothetical protein